MTKLIKFRLTKVVNSWKIYEKIKLLQKSNVTPIKLSSHNKLPKKRKNKRYFHILLPALQSTTEENKAIYVYGLCLCCIYS